MQEKRARNRKDFAPHRDCLRDFALSRHEEREILVQGVDRLPGELREYCREAIRILEELSEKSPRIRLRAEDE